MRELGLFAVLLALLLVLAGCPTSEPTSTGDTGAAPPVAKTTEAPGEAAGAGTPEEAGTAAPAEVETHPTAKIADLKVGDELDKGAFKVTHETKTFTPDSPSMYLSGELKGVAKGDTVVGTLIAVDVTDSEGTRVQNQEVKSAEIEMPAEERPVEFGFSAPTTGWPVGTYRVDITGNGKLIETVELTVEEESARGTTPP